MPNTGLQRRTRLVVSAEPNSGLGRYPGCDAPDITIRRINGILPDEHGRFLLSAEKCYWVRQPQELVTANLLALTPATLGIGNDCGPCCVCDDYVRVYKGLRRIWASFKEIGTRATATRDLHAQNILRFEESKACRAQKILDIVVRPSSTDQVEFAAGVCNSQGDCSVNVELRVTVTVTVYGGDRHQHPIHLHVHLCAILIFRAAANASLEHQSNGVHQYGQQHAMPFGQYDAPSLLATHRHLGRTVVIVHRLSKLAASMSNRLASSRRTVVVVPRHA